MNTQSIPEQAGNYTKLAAETMMDAMSQLRTAFEGKVSTRVSRGDVRTAILALLAEQPMHGYQLIREIEERTDGRWKPSAGSVYPTLQLLADEGLVTAEMSQDRKTYSLTEAGAELAKEAAAETPWAKEEAEQAAPASLLPKAGMELAQAVAQINRSGTPEQKQQAKDLLDETRRKIYSILAQS
ncbi:PadR family transcriptional regulator [Demequina sp.]|uniref:PadR family transcriptional regulator n=1 Tax=Demequina sp. TaxID=2050685 RepID=UPI003D127289